MESGEFAANWARNKVGFPDGISLLCDLGAVASGTPTKDIIDFCVRWHEEVEDGGYAPGIYIGDRAHLSGGLIADSLPIEHYWLAFNEDFSILGRFMKQMAVGANSKLRPPNCEGVLVPSRCNST